MSLQTRFTRCHAAFLCAVFCSTTVALAQPAYFADGYHGGIYGHYPDWVTRFMVDQLKQHPQWRINLEIEPETWDRVKTVDPPAYQQLKLILEDQSAQGKIEYVNPGFAQAYLWNISGESVLRQFQRGMEKIREHFPQTIFSTYCSEEPCFTSALPGILKSLGFKYAVLKNPDTCWGGYTRAFGGELINWIGPDGNAIVTVPRYGVEAPEGRSTWQTIAWHNSPQYLQAARKAGIAHPIGMCLQDAGWRNGPWMGEEARYKTWRDYIENCSIKTSAEDWKFSQEDILVSLVWGSQVLQQVAQQVRQAENKILLAEKLDALARVCRQKEGGTDSIAGAWRPLLLAQHHDCWIVPYNQRNGKTWASQAHAWTEESKSASEKIIRDAMNDLSGNPGSNYVRVFNTLGSSRTDLVSVPWPSTLATTGIRLVADETEIPAQINASGNLFFCASLPAFGFKTFRIAQSPAPAKSGAQAVRQASGLWTLRSDLYSIVVDPTRGGAIKSLVAGGKEMVDQKSARRFNELRGNFFVNGGVLSSADQPATVRVAENGPVRATLEIVGKIGIHPITQTISLTEGMKRIDCTVRIDWQGKPRIGSDYAQNGGWQKEDPQKAFYNDREKLLLMFPLNLSEQQIFKNAPFDVLKSGLSDTFFTRWDEIKNNVILNWVDVTDGAEASGVALLTDHTTSYYHGPGHPLGLTVQYAGVGLWGHEYNVEGPTTLRYALVPHGGRWDTARIGIESDAWNEPLLARMLNASSESAKSLLDLGSSDWKLSTAYVKNGDMFVRLFNEAGDGEAKEFRFDGAADSIELVELNGAPNGPLSSSRRNGKTIIRLAIPRFGIRTIRFAHARSESSAGPNHQPFAQAVRSEPVVVAP